MKTAIVHEWFVNYMGSEKCVESFTNIYPDADIFALIDFLEQPDRDTILKGKHASTSFIQKLPFAKSRRTFYLPLYPLAVEQFDLSDYNIILSSSHSVAKGALTRWDQMHVCYCHTPIRYAWDLYHQYLRETGLSKGIKGMWAKYVLHKIRQWDISSANRPDYYIANSRYIANRIKKTYNRDAVVIYPPVDTHKFSLQPNKENYYIAISRFVPYKKMDIVVEAFSKMPDKKLLVVGDGPDTKRIKSLASPNIALLGYLRTEELKTHLEKARVLVFPAEEDFGITVVEALACGTPVIALNRGGTAETITNEVNGLHFSSQTAEGIIDAVTRFEKIENKFNPEEIRNSSLRFSRTNFENNIRTFISDKSEEFFNRNSTQ
ncbi:MAG: glycosyltransferase family 4 protein [Ignavibacteriaceae bacterium]